VWVKEAPSAAHRFVLSINLGAVAQELVDEVELAVLRRKVEGGVAGLRERVGARREGGKCRKGEM
jgi:hypothetical protein